MNNLAVCPVCSGSGRVASKEKPGYHRSVYGYDSETNTLLCRNCGGQYMSLKPTGKVPRNRRGHACVHKYQHSLAGRCYHRYTCVYCNDEYHIDSGD